MSKFLFRHQQDPMMNFTEALSKSRRALVLFPAIAPDRETLASLIDNLTKRFSADGMVLFLRDDQLFSVSYGPVLRTVTYHPKDVNYWFLPRKDLLRRLQLGKFDVALDLNLDLNLVAATVCKNTRAPLRIGFKKRGADQFYNFQVQSDHQGNMKKAYHSLIKCMDMF